MRDTEKPINRIEELQRLAYEEARQKPKTPDEYRRREYTLHISEQDLDILLFKLSNNIEVKAPAGTFPDYPGETWFAKKAQVYGRLRLLADVMDYCSSQGLTSIWDVIREV